MRALVCERLGEPTLPLGADGPVSLRDDWPSPEVAPGCLKLRVTAASLNFPDALQIRGQYQVKLPLPFVPGNECAGVVVACGQSVQGFTPGDLVCAVAQGGCFAEEAVVHAGSAWKVPPGVDSVAAAGIPIVYGTADVALRHRARLAQGQTLLVLGASGGVGTAAVQIGKLLGARVVAVTAGAPKAAYLAQLGADAVVDTAAPRAQGQPLHKLVAAAAGKGVRVDVVFDPVGGGATLEALKTVSWGAQLLLIGFATGSIPKLPANLLLVKNVTAHGVFWGSYMQHDYATLAASMAQVLAWVGEGALQPQVSHCFGLGQLPEAMAALLGRQVRGKVILRLGEAAEAPPPPPQAASAGAAGPRRLQSRL